MPAARANSDAVSARPSISACSIAARAGSPARAATSANADWLVIVQIPAKAIAFYACRDPDGSAATVTFSIAVPPRDVRPGLRPQTALKSALQAPEPRRPLW